MAPGGTSFLQQFVVLTGELARGLLAKRPHDRATAPVLLLRRQGIVLRLELEQLVQVAAKKGARIARRLVHSGSFAQDRVVKAV